MINTPRYILRPIQSKDAQEVFDYRKDSSTNKYQFWIPKSIEEVSDFISKNPKNFNSSESWFQLVIENSQNAKIVGDIGIHFIGDDNYQCELGCTISKFFQNDGIATEVLNALINYFFMDLEKHRIIVSVDPRNTAAIKLVEKLGFRKEAHFKKSLLINGNWVDDLVYAILKDEWEEA